ncbi:MAG: MBL fold metallo-hydrolase, partial [Armatimonadetes bacterium]|nr:MBL fold metallo-hydrolase [Armatimonadota bacterium]
MARGRLSGHLASSRLGVNLAFSGGPRFAILLVAIATVAIWAYALQPVPPRLELAVLDVGEGLCAVMRTPKGRTMVVDCGTSSWRDDADVGAKLVVPYLQSLGVDIIDVAVLTHPHADHVVGFPGLLELKPAALVLDIGQRSRSPHYRRFLKVVKSCGAKYRIARRGQSIDMG